MSTDKSASPADANLARTAVEAAIPHRAPMLLVDEIIEQSATEIHCRKTFVADEFFTQGHFPNYPLVPGVILCECALQSGAHFIGPTCTSSRRGASGDSLGWRQIQKDGSPRRHYRCVRDLERGRFDRLFSNCQDHGRRQISREIGLRLYPGNP
ncbi:MAG: hypothetical protein R3C56_06215 [Pirellulaceae bacterium]